MDPAYSRCLDATEDTERVWGMLLLQKTHGTVDRHQREQEVMNFWIKEEKNETSKPLSPEKRHMQRRFERPPKTLVKWSSESFS